MPWCLVLLTLFGGILRFTLLSSPSIWGDEAAVFRRTCGSLRELFDELAHSGFTPLHYLLYWTIGQFTTMTPLVMRLPVALAGTAMVPAMYWLAVQIVPRPAAMLAALFTACSAFLLHYSRDAKMYMDCWLFITLSTASLLWWLRLCVNKTTAGGQRPPDRRLLAAGYSQRHIAWLCWVAASLAMVGIHGVAAVILPIQAIIVLSHDRPHWKRAVGFVAGLVIVLVPLVTYYHFFNRYYERSHGDWTESGLMWVTYHNDGRDAFDLIRTTGMHFLLDCEWPRGRMYPEGGGGFVTVYTTVATALLAAIAAGVLRWRKSANVSWRGVLWIGAWLTLPLYGFLVASDVEMPPPWNWPVLVPALAAAAAVLCIRGPTWRQRLARFSMLAAVGVVLWMCCVAVYLVIPPQPGSVWMPRYLGILWPAFAIAAAVLLMRLPTRPLRYAAVATLVGINLVLFGTRIFTWTEPPTELIVRDMLASSAPGSDTRTFTAGAGTGLFDRADWLRTPPGRYYAAVLSGQPVSPPTFNSWFESHVWGWPLTLPPQLIIPGQLAANPHLKRIIIWDRRPLRAAPGRDLLVERLGTDWQRVSEDEYRLRERWTWRVRAILRRRVYQHN